MGAYEGVRADALTAGVHVRADGADAPGELFRSRHRHQKPADRPAVSRQHHPAVADFADRAQAAGVLPGREPAGDGVEPAGQRRSRTTTSTRSCSASIRTSATRLACISATTGTTASRATSAIATPIPDPGGHAAPRQQEHAVLLHAHAAAEPVNDFRDRLSPDRFRHPECLLGGRHRDAGADLGIPGFNGDVRYNNPGIPTINISDVQRAWHSGDELVPVRHDVPDVERHGLQPRLA